MTKHVSILILLFVNIFVSKAQEKEITSDFIKYVRLGDTTSMQKIFDTDFDINKLDDKGLSPLWHSVDVNCDKTVEWLLKRGSEVDLYSKYSNEVDPTPFLLAGAKGYTEIIKILLPYKPDVSIRNRYGGSALIPACEKGYVETVKLLLEKSDIDVNLINNLHWTALMEAVTLGNGGEIHQEIVKMLLEHGADSKIPDKNGITVLEHAQNKGYKEIINILENHLE